MSKKTRKLTIDRLKLATWYMGKLVKTGEDKFCFISSIDLDEQKIQEHMFNARITHRNGHYFYEQDDDFEFILIKKAKCVNLHQLKHGAWYLIRDITDNEKAVVQLRSTDFVNMFSTVCEYDDKGEVVARKDGGLSLPLVIFEEEIKGGEKEAWKVHLELLIEKVLEEGSKEAGEEDESMIKLKKEIEDLKLKIKNLKK